MSCEQALERMMRALDGDLGPTGRGALEGHLADCAPCQAEWARLQALEGLLEQAPMVRPPLGFRGRVLARVDRRRRVQQTFVGGLALAAGTAVIAVLVLAPTVSVLPHLIEGLAAFSRAGDVILAGLVDATGAALSTVCLIGRVLILPAVPLAFCGLVMALSANLVWLGLVRRLKPARTNLVRR